MGKNSRLVVALCLLLITASAHTESLADAAFHYKGGKLNYLDKKEVFSAWNANDPKTVLSPGMKVMFFGRAEDCEPRAANGPVTNQGNERFGQALELTGIPLAKNDIGQRWTPSANSLECNKSIRNQVGDSFVVINDDPVNGGIGMYTYTGPDQSGQQSFFRQFDNKGKNGTGANANIEGTFAAFRFAWQRGETVRPWASDAQPVDKRTAEIKTVQSVAVESVGNGTDGNVVQAQQEMIIALINPHCIHTLGSKRGSCVFQYVFNIAVFRAGVIDWDQELWYRAGLFFDKAQGGIPIVHGPIGHKGETTKDEASGLGLFSSLGDSSYHTLFTDRTFRIQISFDQFKNALKLIAGKQKKMPPNDITSSDLISVFGEKWDDPEQWLLATINLGQEVHSPMENARAYIGGSIKEITIGSVPLD